MITSYKFLCTAFDDYGNVIEVVIEALDQKSAENYFFATLSHRAVTIQTIEKLSVAPQTYEEFK